MVCIEITFFIILLSRISITNYDNITVQQIPFCTLNKALLLQRFFCIILALYAHVLCIADVFVMNTGHPPGNILIAGYIVQKSYLF